MKEAFEQLSKEGFENEDEDEEIQLHVMVHHAYNDYYYRANEPKEDRLSCISLDVSNDESHKTNEPKEVNPADHAYFVENAKWLLEHVITDNMLKAEYYREIGEFDKAKSLLSTVEVDETNDFFKKVFDAISTRVNEKDDKVFKFDLE